MDNHKEYLIYNYRSLCFWIFALVSLIFPFILVISRLLDLIPTLIIFGICFLSGQFLAKLGLQPLRIILTNEKIKFEYLSRDLLSIRRSKEALISNIEEFSDYIPGYGLRLTLYFKNHMTFHLYKHHFFNKKDDFERLLTDFRIISEMHEKQSEFSQRQFPKYFNYYTSKDAKFLVYVSIISIIGFILISILTNKYGLLILILIPLGYLIRFYQENKK